jgi:Tol biopolymer transport system component
LAREGGALVVRLIRIALLSVLLVGSQAPVAEAAYPGANGKIAYSGGYYTGHQVWTVNPGGTGAAQVVPAEPVQSWYLPTWSPDGTKIAYAFAGSTSPVPRWELHIMRPDGTGSFRVRDLVLEGFVLLDKPAWSPDGQTLAIALNPRREEEFGVCVRDWYWDYFDRRNCGPAVYTLNANGTGLTRLTSGFEPAWSPRGTRIAFSAYAGDDTELFTMRPDGTDVRALTGNAFRDEEPSWSPDGRRIAFASDRDGEPVGFTRRECCTIGPGEIYTMRSDGGDVRRVTLNTALESSPAWSPDGTRIAFATSRRTPNCDPVSSFPCQSDVYTMNADGSDQRVLAFLGFDADWQPIPRDNRPPDCTSVTASPSSLHPANHQLRTVSLTGGNDPDGDAVSIEITGVTQDEPVRGQSDSTGPDAGRAGLPDNQVALRAERAAQGDGRVYRIEFDGLDERGGFCSGIVKVSVPRHPGMAVDSAPPSYDSFEQ